MQKADYCNIRLVDGTDDHGRDRGGVPIQRMGEWPGGLDEPVSIHTSA